MQRRLLRDTPVSVLDFETTGLSAKGGARVVEVAVARIVPGSEPKIILDTLIDPEGPVLCTTIHGIEDADVVGAPKFSEIIGDLVLSLEGSIVGAFNASFDMGFLAAETKLAVGGNGLRTPPHVCFMWLRPLLGLSKRCSLDVACQQHGLRAVTHRAAEDALACGHMWQYYVAAAESRGLRTWGDLVEAGSHKYLNSLTESPYSEADIGRIGVVLRKGHRKPRATAVVPPKLEIGTQVDLSPQPGLGGQAYWTHRMYWCALIGALADGRIDQAEVDGLRRLRLQLGLSNSTTRDAHARLFADTLRICAEDGAITDAEATKLRDLRAALEALGWAPG